MARNFVNDEVPALRKIAGIPRELSRPADTWFLPSWTQIRLTARIIHRSETTASASGR